MGDASMEVELHTHPISYAVMGLGCISNDNTYTTPVTVHPVLHTLSHLFPSALLTPAEWAQLVATPAHQLAFQLTGLMSRDHMRIACFVAARRDRILNDSMHTACSVSLLSVFRAVDTDQSLSDHQHNQARNDQQH